MDQFTSSLPRFFLVAALIAGSAVLAQAGSAHAQRAPASTIEAGQPPTEDEGAFRTFLDLIRRSASSAGVAAVCSTPMYDEIRRCALGMAQTATTPSGQHLLTTPERRQEVDVTWRSTAAAARDIQANERSPTACLAAMADIRRSEFWSRCRRLRSAVEGMSTPHTQGQAPTGQIDIQ